MKDCAYEKFGINIDGSAARPNVSAKVAIEFCLRQLGRDRTKRMSDEVVDRLTYEELVGALLLGLDAAGQVDESQGGG